VIRKICKECGREFFSKGNKTKLCSKKCAIAYTAKKNRKGKILTCLNCGKKFYAPKYNLDRKFCSKKCANRFNASLISNKLKRRIKVKCDYCGKIIERIPSKLEAYKNHFCSLTCLGKFTIKKLKRAKKIHIKGKEPWNKGIGDVIIKCANCGKEFKSLRCKKRKYCSHKCALQAVVRKRRSSLELMIEKVLKSLNLNFEPQYKYNNDKWIADFYLPDYKLFIECDGDYWHSLPERKKVDIEKDAWIIANGYDILRLGERLIRKEIDNCLKKIKEKILIGDEHGRNL